MGAAVQEKRQKGFTLAEVLITLGIIGIVAAMTLPSIVGNYKKKEIITRIKKFDSMMSQAVLLSEAQNGDAKYWEKVNTIIKDDDGNDVYDNNAGPEATYNFITKYIAPYIKYYRIEKSVIQPNAPGEKMLAIYFSDGSIAYAKNGACIDFRLDVNGLKNPNKDGSDIFVFALCPWNPSFYFGNANRKWGTLCDKSRNDREALIRSKTCASRILELDNWEFRDDYPWKF